MKTLFRKMKTKTNELFRRRIFAEKHTLPGHAAGYSPPTLKVRGYVSRPGDCEQDRKINEGDVRVGRNKDGGFIAFPA